MKKLIVLLMAVFCCLSARASTASVSVLGVTAQQVLLQIAASDSSACAVQFFTDSAHTQLTHDTDESLFTGSTSCHRTGALVNGNTYTLAIGQRLSGVANDGITVYSRSLEVDTNYYWQVSLGGTVAASGTVTTRNKETGDTSPDQWQYLDGSWGGWPWPTVAFTDSTKKFIDPKTGFALQYTTNPFTATWDNGYQNIAGGVQVENPNSATGWAINSTSPPQDPPGSGFTFNTYSGAGGKTSAIFLRRNGYIDSAGNGYSQSATLSDEQVTISGYGDPVYVCLTVDFANSCLTNALKLTFPEGSSASSPGVVSTPTPQPGFGEWGGRYPSINEIQNPDGIYVNVSGGVAIATSGHFPIDALKPGMAFETYAADLTNYQRWTITSVVNSTTLDVSGGGSDVAGEAIQFVNYGWMLWKDPAGSTGSTAISSAKYVEVARSTAMNYGPAADKPPQCDSTLYDIFWDANGNAYPNGASHKGRLCYASGAGGATTTILLIPDTGEARKIFDQGDLPTKHLDYYEYDTSQQKIVHCYYNINSTDDPNGLPPGHWAALTGAGGRNPSAGCFTLPNQSETIPQIIAAAHPEIDQSYWGNVVWYDTQDVDYPYFKFSFQRINNFPAWECIVDLSKTDPVQEGAECFNTFSSGPFRWMVSHAAPPSYLANRTVNGNTWEAMKHDYASGALEYDVSIDKVYDNTGSGTSLTNTFVDGATCEALGVTDPNMIAQGATGNRCIKIHIPNEPLDYNPCRNGNKGAGGCNGGEGDGGYPDPLTPLGSYPVGSREGPWSGNDPSCGGSTSGGPCYGYLQPIQVGDTMLDASGSWGLTKIEESFLVAAKTVNGSGGYDLVLERGYCPFAGGYCSYDSHGDGWGTFMTAPYLEQNSGAWTFPDSLGHVPTLADSTPIDWTGLGAHGSAGCDSFGNCSSVQSEQGHMPDNLGGYTGGYAVTYNDSDYSVQMAYGFNGAYTNLSNLGYVQSHPSATAGDAAILNNSIWQVDGRPIGGAGGGDPTLWSRSVTLVGGFSHIYDVGLSAANVDMKNLTLTAWIGQHNLKNISGPTSSLSDVGDYTFCYAYRAAECFPASVQGHAYVDAPGVDTTGTCLTFGSNADKNATFTPCVVFTSLAAANVVQYAINKPDYFGFASRALTSGLDGPGRTDNYMNAHIGNTGDYLQGVSINVGGTYSEDYLINMPPYPARDSIARMFSENVPVKLPSGSGQARVRFGYAEYGTNGSGQPLYCSGNYHDECVANSTTGTFSFKTGDSAGTMDCTNGCTINIPAFSGRVLYYVIDETVGGVTSSSPVTAVVTP